MSASLKAAVRESILRNCIVHLDYHTLAAALREEASDAGDLDMVQSIDEAKSSADRVDVIAALIMGLEIVEPDIEVEDHVVAHVDASHEIWGSLGDDHWRVHIDIDQRS